MGARDEDIRREVVKKYGQIARRTTGGCGCGPSCCSESAQAASPERGASASTMIGYLMEDLGSVPEGADMALGCGNPQAIAALQPGEVVLDLGSGGGIDCFLTARQVGPQGRVIGIDMTPDMVARARENARKGNFSNVEFRLGEIEHLPVADEQVDVILSNCVINLSPDKPQVFREAFRVLKPGGRLAMSDVVAEVELPEEIRNDPALNASCIGGAVPIGELENMLCGAGFEQVSIAPRDESRQVIAGWAPGHRPELYVVSATIEAVKGRALRF
jgi:arsenite methyltransferase